MVVGGGNHSQDGMFLRKIPSKIAGFHHPEIIRSAPEEGLRLCPPGVRGYCQRHGDIWRAPPVHSGFTTWKAPASLRCPLSIMRGSSVSPSTVSTEPSKWSATCCSCFPQKYMQKPMHLFGNTGVFLFAVGALINLYLIVLKILGQDIWGKPLLITGPMLVIAGIQLVTIGIVIEIQMRTYFESQQKRYKDPPGGKRRCSGRR